MKKSKKLDLDKEYSMEEIEAGLQIAHTEYFTHVAALLSLNKSNKDMTYVKCPVTTPDGGTYLVSILHVEGPKLNVQLLTEAAKAEQALKGKKS